MSEEPGVPQPPTRPDGRSATDVRPVIGLPAFVDERMQSRALVALLRMFVALTLLISLIGLAVGQLREAAISAAGSGVYGLLLVLLRRWEPRRVGVLCTAWYFVLATAAMVSGHGIYDVTIVLFPAGILMGALLLDRRLLYPLIGVTVVIVAGVGVAQATGLLPAPRVTRTSLTEVVVVSLLLTVAAGVTLLVVRSLQESTAERRLAEAAELHSRGELEARNDALRLVNELAHRLHHSLDLEVIGRETVDVLIRYSQPPLVAFYLLEDDGAHLSLAAHHGFTDEELALGARLPLEGSLSGIAVREQRLVTSDDLGKDPRAHSGIRAAMARRGTVTTLSIPLGFDGTPLGSVNLVFASRRPLSRLDLDTFTAIGQAVSLALANARHIARLEYRAYHDSLTALPNRAGLHRDCDRLLASSPRDGAKTGLVLFDLDRFREINEALGHHVGDELLIDVSTRLSSYFGNTGTITYRLGGDEFVVLLPGLGDAAAAHSAAEELLAMVKQPFEVRGMTLEMGASIGVAIHPDHGGDSHQLLRCADVAMYRAKRTSGGIVGYSPDLDEHTPERLARAVDLGKAIHRDELVLHYQPKVDLGSGRTVGFEALVRWQHPRLGLLPPAEFVPLAEVGDVIHPLTYWVVETALRQLRSWHELDPTLTMAINLSMRNLREPTCAARLGEIVRGSGVDPARVEFELTETVLMSDPETALRTLARITGTGVRLAIDDFGAGYSSLTYLKRLPVHTLKIDGMFVRDILRDAQSLAIVRSTVFLAKSLGLTAIAECVESREVSEALRRAGCDVAQGFFFALPAPGEEIERWLRAAGSGPVAAPLPSPPA